MFMMSGCVSATLFQKAPHALTPSTFFSWALSLLPSFHDITVRVLLRSVVLELFGRFFPLLGCVFVGSLLSSSYVLIVRMRLAFRLRLWSHDPKSVSLASVSILAVMYLVLSSLHDIPIWSGLMWCMFQFV